MNEKYNDIKSRFEIDEVDKMIGFLVDTKKVTKEELLDLSKFQINTIYDLARQVA